MPVVMLVLLVYDTAYFFVFFVLFAIRVITEGNPVLNIDRSSVPQ
nr:hypothetical protein [Citrobacter freundii]